MSTMDMPSTMTRNAPAHSHKRTEHRLEFLAYAAIAFPLFLIACTVWRLVSLPMRLVRGGDRKPSVFAEASEMTNSVLPWVFMGR